MRASSIEPVVVIGAGPAGMSTAWQLAKRGVPVEVIEEDTSVGGLAKTISHRTGMRYDYGPHTFHIRETESSRRVVSEVESLLNGRYSVLDRGTRLFLRDRYFAYPPEFSKIIRNVSPGFATRIVWDYAYAVMRQAFHPAKKLHSFEDWGVRNLGRTLYDTFFGLYSEKVWGVPMAQVSSLQAQRVAKLNLKNIILRMCKFKADPETYFIKYLYPNDGIGNLFQRMADAVVSAGGKVHLGARATGIQTNGQEVRAVTYHHAGKEVVLACKALISTLPLSAVVSMLAPAPGPATLALAGQLDYCSLILVYLVVDRPRVTDFHWCYLIEPKFKSNRFSEQKNVSPNLLPADKTVLCVEMSCRDGDDLWRTNDADLGRIAIDDLVQLGILQQEDVEEHFVARIRYAYPIYRLGFERVLHPLLKELHQLQNFFTIGRHGLFMNNSMDDNVEIGIRLAEHIAKGDKRESWWRNILLWTHLERASQQ